MDDRPLHIAFLAAEALPYAKAGGLGDVAGALPRAIAQAGHRVTLLLPLHGVVDREAHGLSPAGEGSLPFPDASTPLRYRRWEHAPAPGLRAILIDIPRYFQRDALYVDRATGEGYADDGERFLAFTLAALDSLAEGPVPVDVIHCNDFHTGLAPALLERNWRDDPLLGRAATLFSIHNLAYQGVFPLPLLARAGISPAEARYGSPYEFWGKLNCMKAGIVAADLVATVSPRYAEEIAGSAEFGHGLEGVLADRLDTLVGVLNGIDTDEWSPATDPELAETYTAATVEAGKAANRRALREEAGLPDLDVPVLGVVSRLVRQKGFDLLVPLLDHLLALPLQLVVLGSGEPAIEAAFNDAARYCPDKLRVWVKYDNRLAHRIEAGADLFLMPSRYEPCGLNQLYSLRYGTPPIVRATGGLADTVRDVTEAPEDGTGFVFGEARPEALFDAIRRALALHGDPVARLALRRRIMGLDFSWSRSAADYLRLYRAAILRRAGDRRGAAALLAAIRASQATISLPAAGQGP